MPRKVAAARAGSEGSVGEASTYSESQSELLMFAISQPFTVENSSRRMSLASLTNHSALAAASCTNPDRFSFSVTVTSD